GGAGVDALYPGRIDGGVAPFLRGHGRAAVARPWLRRCVQRQRRLGRRQPSGDRPGADRGDDREPSLQPVVATVHELSRDRRRLAPARLRTTNAAGGVTFTLPMKAISIIDLVDDCAPPKVRPNTGRNRNDA